MIWFTSDTHFLHKNVLKFGNGRSDIWKSIEEMNDGLVDNINAVVGVNDELYHLGDFSFKGTVEEAAEIRRKIRCRKVHLIHGNHDKDWRAPELEGLFIIEPEIRILKISGRRYVLSHFPQMDWEGMSHGSIHLHGHIHSEGSAYNELNRSQHLLRYDVGVDANNCMPVSIDTIHSWFDGVETRGRVPWTEWAMLRQSDAVSDKY